MIKGTQDTKVLNRTLYRNRESLYKFACRYFEKGGSEITHKFTHLLSLLPKFVELYKLLFLAFVVCREYLYLLITYLKVKL